MIIRKHYGDFSKKMPRRKIDEMKIVVIVVDRLPNRFENFDAFLR